VSSKSVSKVLTEALVVGVLLIVMYDLTKKALEFSPILKQFVENKYVLLLSTGILFHIVCEYSGLNRWYALDYCSKISNAL
jgi:hypothetical protein